MLPVRRKLLRQTALHGKDSDETDDFLCQKQNLFSVHQDRSASYRQIRNRKQGKGNRDNAPE